MTLPSTNRALFCSSANMNIIYYAQLSYYALQDFPIPSELYSTWPQTPTPAQLLSYPALHTLPDTKQDLKATDTCICRSVSTTQELYYITSSNMWTILENIRRTVNKVTEIENEVRVCIYMEPFVVRQVTRSKTRLGSFRVCIYM